MILPRFFFLKFILDFSRIPLGTPSHISIGISFKISQIVLSGTFPGVHSCVSYFYRDPPESPQNTSFEVFSMIFFSQEFIYERFLLQLEQRMAASSQNTTKLSWCVDLV